MRSLLNHALALSTFALAPSAARADVWIVDAAGLGEFEEIQDAIYAARNGDTLLIRPGQYEGFSIVGKGLQLLSETGSQILVTGQVRVANVASWQQVTLANLSVFQADSMAIELSGASGAIRVRDCPFEGKPSAVHVESCLSVAFTDCSMLGLEGEDYTAETGGHALEASASTLAIHGCLLAGGRGGDGDHGSMCFPKNCEDGGTGGTAARLTLNSVLFAADSHFEAGGFGEGGHCVCPCWCFDGEDGRAVWIVGAATARFLDCATIGEITGNVELLPGAAKSISLPAQATESTQIELELRGTPGDVVRISGSPDADYDYVQQRRGVDLLGEPFASVLAAIAGPLDFGDLRFPGHVVGTIPANGKLNASVRVLPMTATEQARVHHIQALFTAPSGRETLSNGCVAISLDESASFVDCPPGTCDPRTLVHVDDDAPNDPGRHDPSISDPLEDGSPEHPFDAIQEAISAVGEGGEVLVRDGSYSGDGNHRIEFLGRELHLRSENGMAHCTIDADAAEYVFYFTAQETPATIVEGFRLTGASRSAIRIESSSPTILRCDISDNTSTFAQGAGIYTLAGSPVISHCLIRRNSAPFSGGGGIHAVGPQGEVTVHNCTIANNQANGGGGIHSSARHLTLEHSTVAYNASSGILGGGGVWIVGGEGSGSVQAELHASNSILWGNSDKQIALQHTTSRANLRYCDVEGAGDGIAGNGVVNWSVGNIDADPFLKAPPWDLHLQVGSPCVDAGDPVFQLPPPAVDIDGDPRRYGIRVDMGSDELILDCNRDGIPDWDQIFSAESPALSPIGADSPQTYTVLSPPVAYSPVVLFVVARADLGDQDERIRVRINGVEFGSVFSLGATDCPTFEDDDRLVIPAEAFNAAVAGGDATVLLLPSSTVDAVCVPPVSYVWFRLGYGDCNANGILDECEIAAGLLLDSNGNGLPDVCE